MKYHILLSRPFDLEAFHRQSQLDQSPRHNAWDLSQQLEATVHQPDITLVTPADRVLSKITSQPAHWQLARNLASSLSSEDFVFCTGEDVGLPLAILAKRMRDRPKIAIQIMAPRRIRVRTLIKLLALKDVIDLFIVNSDTKFRFLKKYLNLPDRQICLLPDQTDVKFFRPGPVTPGKQRPLVASSGLEQRDYKTLAEATSDLDVDVKICAISPNASSRTRVSFPETIPDNMSLCPYAWPEFRQLYWDADVVVISTLQNQLAAGQTVLMEALACRRPVVVTRIPGLSQQFIDLGLVTGVEVGDAVGMKQAILNLLANRAEAEAQAQRGYEYVLQHHSSELQLRCLIEAFKSIESSTLNSKEKNDEGTHTNHPLPIL
jgi:glycosyltransferase involved in cell wall biosynthesis